MIKRYTTVINGNDKGLPGIDKIIYIRDVVNNQREKTRIIIPGLNGEILINGHNSKKIFMELNSDEVDVIEIIKEIACNATRIDIGTLESRTRKPAAVFARNCVIWYAIKYKKLSLSQAGAIFNLDHSTAIYAKKDFEKESQYQSPQRVKWKQRFLDKLTERSKTNTEIYETS